MSCQCAPLGTPRSDVAAVSSFSMSRDRQSVSERSCCGRPMNNLLSVSSAQPFKGILYLSRFRFSEGAFVRATTTSIVAALSPACLLVVRRFGAALYMSELLVLLLLPSLRRFPFGSTIVSLSSSAIFIITTRPTTTTMAPAVAGRPFSRSPAGSICSVDVVLDRTGPPVLVHLP